MPCTPFRLPSGVSGIVCTRGRKRVSRCSVPGCNASSGFQCDYRSEQGKTCDRHLCAVHAHQVGSDAHFCPTHLAESSGTRQPQGNLFEI
jgi:hypothetical protein